MSYSPLFDTLSLAVPLHIAKFKTNLGEDNLPVGWREAVVQCEAVLERADDLILFRSKKKGENAEAFNTLARAIAILSFWPGGIRFGGTHYDAKLPFPHAVSENSSLTSPSDRPQH